ncbi:MAG TPA: MerR family transcriptional regulator [Mycobacteriales bacterium]|nr:MerR family transcriptional regulator [Mycobacteriales bacterium]
MQIGEVADRTALSLRTIRYYEEVGLVPPSARTQGGFRLYTEQDVERLLLVRRMKPLDFSIDEMRDLLGVLDDLDRPELTSTERRDRVDRLVMYRQVAETRVEALRSQLESAEQFAESLREQSTGRSSAGRTRSAEPARPTPLRDSRF